MLKVSPSAKKQLDTHFSRNELSPLRIYLAGGCGGPRLALALDTQREDDTVLEIDGYSFLIESALLQEAQPITVKFDSETGFTVESNLNLEQTSCKCESCSSCCG